MSIVNTGIFLNCYPSATSNIIITINPKVNQSVEAVLWVLLDSGISSDTQVAIIAPAEKLKSSGRMDLIWNAKTQPKTPANGSTSPLACPINNAFPLLIPSRLKGSDVATPSGQGATQWHSHKISI